MVKLNLGIVKVKSFGKLDCMVLVFAMVVFVVIWIVDGLVLFCDVVF